jgi:hypothetical protein
LLRVATCVLSALVVSPAYAVDELDHLRALG